MSTNSVCFRFDVDTARCLTEGMPALLDLAQDLGVRFTFFVNPGRAISRRLVLSRSSRKCSDSAPKLSSLRKLGVRGYLHTAAINPVLSRIDRAGCVARAVAEGHEVGLHGGRNHAQWQRFAHEWHVSRLEKEIAYGYRALREMGVRDVNSFASPGWNSPEILGPLLRKLGFRVLADARGVDVPPLLAETTDTPTCVATDLLGEPAGVGYLEWRTATGDDRSAALAHFVAQLEMGGRPFRVVYDHPCFAGVEGLVLLRQMISYCRAANIDIVTLSWLATGQVR